VEQLVAFEGASDEFKPATVQPPKERDFRSRFVGGGMKKILMVLGHLHADTKRESKDRCQTATVVTVDKHVSEKHVMYGSLPDGDREVKMEVVGHSRLKEKGCVTN
jgi:hypothetical protein